MSNLKQIIQGCLNPNTVQASEKALVDYSQKGTFLSELLQLVPGQQPDLLVMILSTIKNFLLSKYNHPHTPISQEQKSLLRQNIVNFFYQINQYPPAISLYCQIVQIVLTVDFQPYKQLFYTLIQNDLNQSIMASTYICRQIAKVYEWFTHEKRLPLEQFLFDFYPQIQPLIEKIMTNYNDNTAKLLEQLLKMFYSSFHLWVPEYFRNYDNIEKWLYFMKAIINSPIGNYPNNHRQVSKIYTKFFSMYCLDSQDGKNYRGWSAGFRSKFAQKLYNEVVQHLVNPINDQQTSSNIVNCIYHITRNPDIRGLVEESHCEAMIYQHLIPFMESTSEEANLFKTDSLEYLRMEEDISCYRFRRMALDLIASLMVHTNYEGKSQLIKLVEYSADILSSQSTDKQKQVILVILTYLSKPIMKNQYLHNNFEQLTRQYFMPLANHENKILSATACKLMSEYLGLIKLSTPIVKDLMSTLYEKMCSDNLVVSYNAVLSFTQLLYDKQALQSAKPYFQNILQIYVKLLDVLDHEKLLKSLEEIVKIFSNEIVMVAKDLSAHLFHVFYSLHKKELQQNHEEDDDQSNQATAAIFTIKQIIQAPLNPETYFSISENVMILLKGICDEYDDCFEEILTLFNILVYKTSAIVDFEFPYVFCRKLLEGHNGILSSCKLEMQLVEIISKAEKADEEYSETLISILKNLIQKMPEHILQNYPLPTNPELLLCLIQNKRIQHNQIGQLATGEVDRQWSMILQSYTSFVYEIGDMCDCSQMQILLGISLFPWIQRKLDLTVVKKVLLMAIEEDEEDNEIEDDENTLQMLEKYAEEDDDDDIDDYYVSSGGNYTYLYNSPFDSSKDAQALAVKVKQLAPNEIGSIMSQLKPKFRFKLQALLSC